MHHQNAEMVRTTIQSNILTEIKSYKNVSKVINHNGPVISKILNTTFEWINAGSNCGHDEKPYGHVSEGYAS